MTQGSQGPISEERSRAGGARTPPPGIPTLDTLLRLTVERHASDLHLTSGVPPMLRIHGRLVPMEGHTALVPADLEALIRPILNDELRRAFDQQGQVDLSHGVPGVGRFRCNVFRQRGSWGMAARVIPADVPPLDQLGLPPVVEELCGKTDGLILVTGPTGSGKSTTLAAMIDHVNRHRKAVVITLEDPIEYLHRHKMSVINQREVGTDTTSFAAALRGALRADPDVILVGEMRDLETVATALRAAETGHLVLSTLHTRGAAETVERVIDMFPPEQQRQIQLQFASTIQAVISQRLLPRVDGQGRVLVCEVMVATPAVRTMIREGKWHQIPAAIETGARFGMRTFEASVRALLERGLVGFEETLALKRG